MDVKPTNGVRVRVSATREAVFGEEGVEIREITTLDASHSAGVLTGRTLVGFCEVEMGSLDGKRHWYPMQQMQTEAGDTIKEEEVPIEIDEEEDEEF
jgi:hypothetical protein